MRRAILVLPLLLLAVGERTAPGQRTPLGPAVPIMATPVVLDPERPARRRFGALRLAEAWRLAAADRAFGGLSALAVDGRRFTLLSDGGGIVRFTLDEAGVAGDIVFGDLADGPGDGRLKEARDSEALARAPDGDWWVAFERSNAIARYDAGFARLRSVAFPPSMAGWGNNTGAEAIVALAPDRVAVFREGGGGAAAHPALLFLGDPAQPGTPTVPFAVRPPAGFRVVDVARLPDGRILALHRRFALREVRFAREGGGWRMSGGWSAMLGVYDEAAIRPGAVLEPQPLATLAPPLLVDNFEGVAVTEGPDGASVWIVSDDNQRGFQRTLLVRFRLDGA